MADLHSAEDGMRARGEEYVSEMKHVDVSVHDGLRETGFLNRVKESLSQSGR